jgi:homoserine kinase
VHSAERLLDVPAGGAPAAGGGPLRLRPGTRARVRVPATSANLGPGFDTLGLALALYDVVDVEVLAGPGVRVEVSGEGFDEVPLDEGHLVVRALRATLARDGVAQPGLRLSCENGVPHGRGLGSSAAAVVSGVVAARALVSAVRRPADDLVLATEIEGHPDNAAAALLGGLTIAWDDGLPRAVRVEPHPALRAVVAVPSIQLSTAHARACLPATVPHADAAFTAGRAALLVEAATRSPGLLFPATHDRLHQPQRASAAPATADLVQRLRARGLAAVVSGAGPSVLVLADSDVRADVAAAAGGAWTVLEPAIDGAGASVVTASTPPA